MKRINHTAPTLALILASSLLALLTQGGEPKAIQVQVYDQIVAKVNSESVSKRDVEERMNGIAEKLYMFKSEKTALKQWDKDSETEWTHMYVEHFRPALQAVIRDRLKLQHFELEKMSIDDKDFQKEYNKVLDDLRSKGNKNFSPADVAKRVKENMKLEEFSGKFNNATELPRKPEVERYYSENMDRYKRRAGVKVRVIRIDQTIVNKLTGVKKVRDNPYQVLEEIRRDIVEFGALFSEVARSKTDDPDLKETGGLILNADKDPFIIAEEYNKTLASEIRELKVGDVSRIFTYGTQGYAIAMIEERREAGYVPLEGKLFDQLYREVRQNKSRKKEDEWFRATLAKSLIMQVVEGSAKPLPIDFFFPDDKKPDGKGPDFVNKDGKSVADKK